MKCMLLTKADNHIVFYLISFLVLQGTLQIMRTTIKTCFTESVLTALVINTMTECDSCTVRCWESLHTHPEQTLQLLNATRK